MRGGEKVAGESERQTGTPHSEKIPKTNSAFIYPPYHLKQRIAYKYNI